MTDSAFFLLARTQLTVTGAIITLVALTLPSGCVMPPKVDSAGTIHEGDPRLQAMLRFIDDRRAKCTGELDGNIVEAAYSGVIGPSELSDFHFGHLPSSELGKPRVSYALAASFDTIRQTAFSVVMEYLVTDAGERRNGCYLLEWDPGRADWFVRRSNKKKSPAVGDTAAENRPPSSRKTLSAHGERAREHFVFRNGKWSESKRID